MSEAAPEPRPLRAAALALGLALATFLLYLPVGGFDFLTIDDGSYVYANPHVRAGLTADGLRWAFTRAHSSNWHPLTWLSHMLDAELFKVRAGAHHLTSAALHGLVAACCFLALRALSLGTAAAFFAAAAFAWHPLRVESVAWVSERKDVLSGLFWMLALLAWAAYARRPGPLRYALCGLLFALGLLAKPMLVTLPLVLLLVDWWPLGRASLGWRRLVLEKLPLLALSSASCVVTVVVQGQSGAVRSLVQLSASDRLSNAVTSVWAYVGKTLWPEPLAAFYPHPAVVDPLSFAPWRPAVLVALAALVAVTASALFLARRAPWLAVGWLWFLGTLVPVIGIVQVGEQAYADRYTYLPSLGLALVVVGGAGALVRALPGARLPLAVAAALVLAALAVGTRRALPPWKDTETLFRHALEVTDHNYIAEYNLGVVLEARGELEEARARYRAALATKPDSADAWYNLGGVARRLGERDEAVDCYRRSLSIRPRPATWVNLGVVLAEEGLADEAEEAFRAALALQPRSAEALANLGGLRARAGALDEASGLFERALAIDPGLEAARRGLEAIRARRPGGRGD